MGKWAARLAEKTAALPYAGTDKTDERGLLSVLAVTPKGSAEELDVPSKVESEPAEKRNALDLAAVAWTDTDIARFLDRRARLVRWRWTEPEAENVAERLVNRDRTHDERVSCIDCRNYRPARRYKPGCCGNHRRAGLFTPAIGKDLACLLQRCPGFVGSSPRPST